MTDQLSAEVFSATANNELRRVSRLLIGAQEKERGRIARELHDDVQQILMGLRMSMEPSKAVQVSGAPEDCIATWIGHVQEAIQHLHALTLTLRAPVLGDRGLASELQSYLNRSLLAPGRNIDLEVEKDLGRFDPELEITCFRIVQEALANAIKHSGSNRISIRLTKSRRNLSVTIHDDGAGFDMEAARVNASVAGRIGLLSMRERAALVGGGLTIESSVGLGTYVRASFPTNEQRSDDPAVLQP